MKTKNLNNTDYQILENIIKNYKISRTDLSKFLELTPAAISKAIKKLITANLIEEKNILSSTGGRPRIALKINKDYKKIIGINLGVGFIRIAVSNLDGEFLKVEERKFSFKTQEKVLKLLDEELSHIIDEYSRENIIGIGLATHGLVDKKRGSVILSPHFKWKNLEIRKVLEKKYDIPIIVENDVRAMLIAENYYGCAKNMKSFILLYIKNGVGSSIFLNGKIFEGSNYGSGEIGHFIVRENSSIQCRCGKYGCLETEYSEQAILDKISWILEEKKIKENNLTIEMIYESAKKREEPYYSMIKEASFEIGKVLGNILNILDVNDIIVSGSITDTGNLFLKYFKKGVDKMLLEDFSKKINIKFSELGDKIGIYGAISLIIDNLFVGEKLLKL